jgi:hypothetical protein
MLCVVVVSELVGSPPIGSHALRSALASTDQPSCVTGHASWSKGGFGCVIEICGHARHSPRAIQAVFVVGATLLS